MNVKAMVLGVACVLSLSMCDRQTMQPPERKGIIPAEAQWYGGNDGGVWIVINASDARGRFNVEIYNEYDGSLEVKGMYAIGATCPDEEYSVQELRRNVSAFDGKRILLHTVTGEKYCTLEPIE